MSPFSVYFISSSPLLHPVVKKQRWICVISLQKSDYYSHEIMTLLMNELSRKSLC